jgi:uncharacterized protein involved in type VI secretion and phage assembly
MRAIRAAADVAVELGGQPVPEADARTLTRATVLRTACEPALCELEFADADEEVSARARAAGATLRLTADSQELFRGDVVAVDDHLGPGHARRLRVRARDTLARVRAACTRRTFVQATLPEVARALTEGFALTVDAGDPGPVWPRLLKHRHDDLRFLSLLAGEIGQLFELSDDTLRFFSADGIGEPHELALGDDLLEVEVERHVGDPPPDPELAHWNWLIGEPVRAPVGGLKPWRERTCTLRGVAEGSPVLRPGGVVTLADAPPGAEGRHVLTTVTHRLGSDLGYVTEFSTAPPAPRPPDPAAPLVTLGMVTSVADPDELGRIQVSLPTWNDLESDWMQVVMPGAGAGKGLIALPDVGDHVLICFPCDWQAYGIVLGGVLATRKPADGSPVDGVVTRFALRTPNGQIVRLDDVEHGARIETQDGVFIELLPKGLRVHARNRLELAAPGGTIVLRADRVDFEKG